MILIISKPHKDAKGLAEMFHYMGFLAYGATPTEALSEISNLYRAVIVMNPEQLASKEDYISRLRAYTNIPIFALSENTDKNDSLIFDGIIKRGSYASKIADNIISYTENQDLKIPGIYKLAGIDASIYLRVPMYFNKALPFTKTETMMLRALITTYPRPVKAKELLKYAFKQTKTPEISNIRTHISVMNKKFREITGRSIVVLTPSEGYRILTPEIMEAIAK